MRAPNQSERAQKILAHCEMRAQIPVAPPTREASPFGSPMDVGIAVELMRLLCDHRTRSTHPKVYALAKAAILELLDSSAKHASN